VNILAIGRMVAMTCGGYDDGRDPLRHSPPMPGAGAAPGYRDAIEKALRCFRMARSATDPDIVGLLEATAQDFLEEARRLLREGS
jgi:hypothetical protein